MCSGGGRGPFSGYLTPWIPTPLGPHLPRYLTNGVRYLGRCVTTSRGTCPTELGRYAPLQCRASCSRPIPKAVPGQLSIRFDTLVAVDALLFGVGLPCVCKSGERFPVNVLSAELRGGSDGVPAFILTPCTKIM